MFMHLHFVSRVVPWMLPLLACSLLVGGCSGSWPGQRRGETPDGALTAAVAEFEALCQDQALPMLGRERSASLCRCVAENHRLQLTPAELQLLIRDYHGEFSEQTRQQNNDLNQLTLHDALVTEACLENPAFRAAPRTLAPQPPAAGRARITASAP